MERDISLIRKKRAEAERVANGLKAQPTPEQATVETAPSDSNELPVEKKLMKHDSKQNGISKGAGLPMPGSTAGPDAQVEASQNTVGDNTITAAQGMPQDSDNSAGLAITMPSGATAKANDNLRSPERKSGGTTPPAEAPLDPTTADFDFESMFNDTDLTATDDAINFDLRFSTEGNMNQDLLNDNAFEEITISNTDIANLGATTNEDINTLLPGLENYVNAQTNFSNISIPAAAASTVPETAQGTAVVATDTAAQNIPQAAGAEANFGDLFGPEEFVMGGTGDEAMGGDDNFGDFEEFSDDWFKT